MNNTIRRKRIEWLDLARTLAIVFVVLCHATEGVYSFKTEYISLLSDHSRIFAFTVFTLGRMGVPIFLMISGYLLLDRKYDSQKTVSFWKNNWLHLLLCTWFWFAVYELFIILFNGETLTFQTILYDMIFFHKVNMSHVWYMPMILGMYILIPFVAMSLELVDLKILWFPVIVFSIFCFGFPLVKTIFNVIQADISLSTPFQSGFSGGKYGLFLIFGYMVKKGAFKKLKTPVVLLISVLFIILSIKLQTWSFSNGIAYTIWYDNLLLMIAAVSFFEALSRLKRIHVYPVVKFVSYYSFAVYLIHNIILQVIKAQITDMEIIMPYKVLIMWIISFTAAIIISYLINSIPKIGKLILNTK